MKKMNDKYRFENLIEKACENYVDEGKKAISTKTKKKENGKKLKK